MKCAYVEKVSHVGKQGAVNPAATWQGCPAKFPTGESLGLMSGFVSVGGSTSKLFEWLLLSNVHFDFREVACDTLATTVPLSTPEWVGPSFSPVV